jgi:endonuclease YncB( thermonuclease family)
MRFIHFIFVTSVLLTSLSFKVNAAPVISYYYDGDTVKIVDASTEYKLRITDIDAPERNQTYGKKSRRALMQLCDNTRIQVILTGVDKYQRQIGNLYCNQQDASTYMLKNGHAWFNKRYAKKKDLAQVEENARKKKLGLWQDEKPIAPWVWRHLVKHP